MRENENNAEAVKIMLEKLNKILDDQNKKISHLTKFIDKQNEFIKMLGGELKKDDNKKSSQNNIQGSKKINRSHQLQDSIGAISSEIAEQDNRISKLQKVVKNNQDKIGSLLCSTSKKLNPDDLSKFCKLINDKLNQGASPDELPTVCIPLDLLCGKKLDLGDLSTILNQSNQSGMQCIYKSNEEEVFGFKFDLSPCNFENGNKSIFKNQSNFGCQFNYSNPSDKKLDPCDLLTILNQLNPSGMRWCIEEVHGFKFDLSPCNFENGNKSIFQDQSNFGYRFNCGIPSCDNQDYKLDEDEK